LQAEWSIWFQYEHLPAKVNYFQQAIQALFMLDRVSLLMNDEECRTHCIFIHSRCGRNGNMRCTEYFECLPLQGNIVYEVD
jgi:hypothetical protein